MFTFIWKSTVCYYFSRYVFTDFNYRLQSYDKCCVLTFYIVKSRNMTSFNKSLTFFPNSSSILTSFYNIFIQATCFQLFLLYLWSVGIMSVESPKGKQTKQLNPDRFPPGIFILLNVHSIDIFEAYIFDKWRTFCQSLTTRSR